MKNRSYAPAIHHPPRGLSDFVDGFIDYCAPSNSPPIFTKWAAISGIAQALERKVHISNSIGCLYPNQYIILVGPPGIGKDTSINPIVDLLNGIEGIVYAPSIVTSQSLIDKLAKNKKTYSHDGNDYIQHPMSINSTEFTNFLPEGSKTMKDLLTEVYPCTKRLEESTRKNGINIIDSPCINILTATTTGNFKQVFDDLSWESGLSARFMFVYADKGKQTKMFANMRDETERARLGLLKCKLQSTLQVIHEMTGTFTIDTDLEDFLDEWDHSGTSKKAGPKHVNLVTYCTRRHAHALKVMQCFSASESSSMRITMTHFKKALALMEETEMVMQKLFTSQNHRFGATVFDFITWMSETQKREEKRKVSGTKVMRKLTEMHGTLSKSIFESYLTSGVILEGKYWSDSGQRELETPKAMAARLFTAGNAH